jgi:alcohol dehydrogenase class IV
MQSYQYFVPTKVIFGLGKVKEIGSILKDNIFEGNILIISDPGDWIEDLLKIIKKSLLTSGFKNIFHYNDVSPNPKLSECDRGIECAKENNSNIFIAVGGGSTMDAAKKIAKDSNADFFITVPTTAGTGSHINEWSVLTRDDNHEKISVQNIAADIAVLDPEATWTMPSSVTLCTGLDSFSHGMEAYFGTGASTLTDLQALKGCQLIVENIEKVISDGNDLNGRANMLEADFLTGSAMINSGLGILHCIANITPGFYPQYSHGYLCGSLLKNTAYFNEMAIAENKRKLIMPLVEKASKVLNESINKYNIEPIKIKESDIKPIREIAAVNVNGITNPRKVTEEAVEKIMRDTFEIIV